MSPPGATSEDVVDVGPGEDADVGPGEDVDAGTVLRARDVWVFPSVPPLHLDGTGRAEA